MILKGEVWSKMKFHPKIDIGMYNYNIESFNQKQTNPREIAQNVHET